MDRQEPADLPAVHVIGAGLAGCEASWQIAGRGIRVVLHEMRPLMMTPVHRTAMPAELVCSNSLGTRDILKAPGLLKHELRMMGSLIMEAAEASSVPAGQALAVDRELFSAHIDERLTSAPLIERRNEEISDLSFSGPAILATGPMTSPSMARSLQKLLGSDYLYFYDAVSPVVTFESLDHQKVFRASRYGKGDNEYLNCPLDEERYALFLKELLAAEKVAGHEGEEKFFEGCLPVEEIASRGPDTLRFGPMKPVGLIDPRTGAQAYAVVQLRQENRQGTLYNLVGFQTRLRWPDQKRVFSLIPGLENAEFVRLGVMHRNIFINAPRCLSATGQLICNAMLMIAGQLSGVEGYMESTASGALCGINAARLVKGLSPLILPPTTACGALMAHIAGAEEKVFQPMNVNFGLFPPLAERIKRKAERNKMLQERALSDMESFLQRNGEPVHMPEEP